MDISTPAFPPRLKAALGLLLVVALGAWALDRAFQAGINFQALTHWQEPASTNDTVTVTGEGKVTAIPDIGLIQLSVESRGSTVSQVQADGTAKINSIVAFLKGLDIAKEDLKTTQYNLYPRYSYNPETGQQRLDGYQLSQTVEVKIRNLDRVGEVLAGAVDRGANQVGGLTFAIDDPFKFEQEARLAAIAQARQKAEALAEAAGIELGEVRSFSENVNNPPLPPVYYSRGLAEADSAAAPQVEAGSQEVTVSVSLSFELE